MYEELLGQAAGLRATGQSGGVRVSVDCSFEATHCLEAFSVLAEVAQDILVI